MNRLSQLHENEQRFVLLAKYTNAVLALNVVMLGVHLKQENYLAAIIVFALQVMLGTYQVRNWRVIRRERQRMSEIVSGANNNVVTINASDIEQISIYNAGAERQITPADISEIKSDIQLLEQLEKNFTNIKRAVYIVSIITAAALFLYSGLPIATLITAGVVLCFVSVLTDYKCDEKIFTIRRELNFLRWIIEHADAK